MSDKMFYVIETARQTYWDGESVGTKAYFEPSIKKAIKFYSFADAEIIRIRLLETDNCSKLRSTQHSFIDE